MNTDRGVTILEVLIAMALLSIGGMGMIGGMLIASNGNVVSRRRTDMLQFAQTRLERLATRERTRIPTATTTGTGIDYSSMSASPFDPNAAPGTGGWMLDVIDGNPPAGGGSLGNDLMAGPLLVEGDLSGVDLAATLSKRSSFADAWFTGKDTKGCGSPTVTSNTAVLCREVHIEPLDATIGGVQTFMFRIWIRVVQGGRNWKSSYVTVTEDVSQ
jgi:prepilin-type N-terminal cleavage/methylation domain-containing protein